MTALKLITDTTLINKAITSIANRGAKLDYDIQLAGLSVLAHVAKHGDSTLADKLVAAMPKGSRKLALVEWILAFGQLSLLDKRDDKDAIAAGRIFRTDNKKAHDQDGAIAKPWHQCRKEPAAQDAFDAQSAVHSVIQRLKAASTKGLKVKNRALALAEAMALVEALKAPAVQVEDAPL